MNVKRFLAGLGLCLLVRPVLASTWYVRKDGNDAVCNGLADAPAASSSGACAFSTIQHGVNAAVVAGDRVRIHSGTYFEAVSVNVSGSPASTTSIEGFPGETVVIDSGEPAFRTPGNSDWELVDASIGEYRSTAPHPGARVYGYIDGVPNYENGRVGLVPYVDSRAQAGGLQGFVMFRAATDAYVDPSTPFYVGPGLWIGRACTGGASPGASCETTADCAGGGTCLPTNRIHIRLSKTSDLRAAEARYGTVLPEEDADPRNLSLIISTATFTTRITGSYLRFANLTFDQALRTVSLESGAHHITFDGVTVWTGGTGIAAEPSLLPPHHITIVRSRVFGDSPYWIFWTDAKDAPFPADRTNGTDIALAGGATDWDISYSHIRGGMDGISTNTNEDNITIHHNRIENFKDDSLEIEGTTDVRRISVFENYIGNSIDGFAPGQQTPTFTGPAFFYRNVVALLRDHPINRKPGIETFNGGFRFGHHYAFKQRSPNTFYYNNTVVLLNSHDRGIAVVPGDPGMQADTYVFNNILVKVNRLVQGPYFTGPRQIVDFDLYWKMNTTDTDPLADIYDTIPALAAATGLEAHGLGSAPKTGTNPRFKSWGLTFDTTDPRRWALAPDEEVWSPGDFVLDPTSPAIGAGMALPVHPVFGLLPDSRASRDLGAIPSAARASDFDIFPFNQGWRGPLVGPDLVTQSISKPPSKAAVGAAFTITDTASNQGVADAAASVTRYYLSTDPVRSGGDQLLTGGRSVPALAVQGLASGSASVTVPPGTPEGLYYTLACADDTRLVVEHKDANNCLASATRIQITAANLIETALSTTASTVTAGGTLDLTDTTSNVGSASCRTSSTRFYLSLDDVRGPGDVLLAGVHAVDALGVGVSSAAVTTVTVPAGQAAGAYRVLACADDTARVIESNEADNCAATLSTIQVLAVDLLESAVGDPPPSVVAGNSASTFTVSDTATNGGQLPAGPSTTRYYLSPDPLKSASDVRLSAVRAVPALAPGAVSSGSGTTSAPAATPEGLYYVIACADDTFAVAEGDEANNCRASAAQVRVTLPDLTELSVGAPPPSVTVGSTFTISDSVINQGSGAAKSSTTRYWLSADAIKDAQDLLLTVTRAIPSLVVGGTSTGSKTLAIPPGTPPGAYLLLTCADDKSAVTESNEQNNCRASASALLVAGPDLVETALAEPPPLLAVGGSMTVTDTVQNQGNAAAPATVSRIYLSADGIKDPSDLALPTARSVGTLAPGASAPASTPVSIPAGTPTGLYRLIVCADDGGLVAETNEANNCRSSSGTVRITAPDLTVTALSDPPAALVSGSSFTVTDTVVNGGDATAAASTTRYFLSSTGAPVPGGPRLDPGRAVPVLAAAASSTGSVTVLVAADVPAGSYALVACADDGGTVPESGESNNCRASAGRVQITGRDFVETAVGNPPAVVAAGGNFSVTDTTQNAGGAPAPGTVVRYYLSTETVRNASSTMLSGTRAVPALGAGATSQGSTTVAVPAAAPAGTFMLLACADDTQLVLESSESNNCLAAAASVQIQNVDLVTTAVSDPPATTVAGNGTYAFGVTDTVANQGQRTAGISTTRYYLSLDTVKDPADVRFGATRAVPSLGAGAVSTGTVVLTAPSATPDGTYVLLACADDTDAVLEGQETNNCRASAGRVRVTVPDLVETAVSSPPASGVRGGSFSVTETAVNSGTGIAKSTTTRFYLSLDPVFSSGDAALGGSRGVPSLTPGTGSTATTSVTIPTGAAAGQYYVIACADDGDSMAEVSETNNCLASIGRIQIGP